MLRAVLGWLLIAVGAATMTLAVAGCAWVYLNVSSVQFDLTPAWLMGAAVLGLGGALLGGGLFVLLRKA